MIKIYNNNHQFLTLIDANLTNIYTTDALDTGQRTLCFQAPCSEQFLSCLVEENYIETDDYEYVIKEIKSNNNKYFTIYCSANIEDIKGSVFLYFDCYDKNLKQGYEYCLSNTDWTVVYHSPNRTVITYQEANVNAYDMLRQIASDYAQELWFDTKNKVLHIYDKMGQDLGAYYSNELRLKQLKFQSNTYDYATVLFPFGKNGLTISNINNGKSYIENFKYSNKYLSKIWINEDIEIPEILLRDATNYLEEIAQPKVSYQLLATELGPDVTLGDSIIIVDKIKNIKTKQRVVKITRYPNQPENDTLEINNLATSFYDMFITGEKRKDKEIKYLRSVISSLE